MEVELVALQADRRLVGGQQVVGDSTVWRVAQAAVLDHRRVLENERAFFALVAGVAQVVQPHVGVELPLGRGMRVVAAVTAHVALWHGMMRRQLELSVDCLVTVLTAVERIHRLVHRVAAQTAHVLHCVGRRVPLALFLESVAVETRSAVLDRVFEGPDQRRISLFHVLNPVAVAALAAHRTTVDLERLDPHVDLVGHRLGDIVVTVHTRVRTGFALPRPR